jgi:hypothetical protein
MKNPTWKRNFRKSLLRPAKGNGRVMRACRRAFLCHDGIVSTSQCIDWAYSPRLLMEGSKRHDHFNRTVRNALVALGATKVERLRTGKGRSWVWSAPIVSSAKSQRG